MIFDWMKNWKLILDSIEQVQYIQVGSVWYGMILGSIFGFWFGYGKLSTLSILF